MKFKSSPSPWDLTGDVRIFRVALVFSFSLAYSGFLASLPVDYFIDRDNYLAYASQSIDILNYYLAVDQLPLFFNEPLWLCINVFFLSFLTPEQVVQAVIATSAVFTAWLAFRCGNYEVASVVFCLLIPQVLQNNVIHLRQGLAIAIFLFGWTSARQRIFWGFTLFAALVHSSFFFFLFFMILQWCWGRLKFDDGLRFVIVLGCSIGLAFSAIYVAKVFGARQGLEYESAPPEVSGFGFLFFFCVTVIYFLQGRNFIRARELEISILVIYLTSYWFLPVSARILESGMIPVLLAGTFLTSYRKAVFYSIIFFFSASQWYSRFSLPGFGWAVENYL